MAERRTRTSVLWTESEVIIAESLEHRQGSGLGRAFATGYIRTLVLGGLALLLIGAVCRLLGL
jgi:hypothetical protein